MLVRHIMWTPKSSKHHTIRARHNPLITSKNTFIKLFGLYISLTRNSFTQTVLNMGAGDVFTHHLNWQHVQKIKISKWPIQLISGIESQYYCMKGSYKNKYLF